MSTLEGAWVVLGPGYGDARWVELLYLSEGVFVEAIVSIVAAVFRVV